MFVFGLRWRALALGETRTSGIGSTLVFDRTQLAQARKHALNACLYGYSLVRLCLINALAG
jgi:hypothetical protein